MIREVWELQICLNWSLVWALIMLMCIATIPTRGVLTLGLYFSLHISLDKCSSEQTFGKIDTNNWLNISPICCLLRDGTCSSTCHTCYRVGIQFLFPFLSPFFFLKVKWMFFFITKRKTFCLYRYKYTQASGAHRPKVYSLLKIY